MEAIDDIPVMVIQVGPDFTVEDVNAAAITTQDYPREEAIGHPVQGVVHLPVTLPQVTLSSDCLPAVLQELFLNATKFANPEIPLQINVIGNLDDQYCQLSISDNGLGFPQEYSARVFEPLSQFHRHKQQAGLGVGLARCQRLVQQLGGSITADGAPGKGATFTIRFPVVLAATDAVVAAQGRH